jgi:uncharacterized protein DUF4398
MKKTNRIGARQTSVVRCGMFVVLLFALAGCGTGPPVQEMSDARQAIAVARDAGAAQLAPDDLRAAESFLSSAQHKLSEREYAQARDDAVKAKNRALEALQNSEKLEPKNY